MHNITAYILKYNINCYVRLLDSNIPCQADEIFYLNC